MKLSQKVLRIAKQLEGSLSESDVEIIKLKDYDDDDPMLYGTLKLKVRGKDVKFTYDTGVHPENYSVEGKFSEEEKENLEKELEDWFNNNEYIAETLSDMADGE